MIAVVDYGVGNLFSLACSLKKINADFQITSNSSIIENANKIILPGVGAFEDAMKKLCDTGLDKTIIKSAENGKHILGICLGMQLMFDVSYEYGEFKGLGLIPGVVRPLKESLPSEFKVPHMGWNSLEILKPHAIFKYIKNREYVYFVHSYHATDCNPYVIATSEYTKNITAAVARDNVIGMQFHPEKSGETGIAILRAFKELE